MSWFEEQLKYRRDKDDEFFTDAMTSIASAVMGKHLTEALSDMEIARSAIDEILKFYHCKPSPEELPPRVDTPDRQLEYCLRPHGIMRRNVKLDRGWYRTAVGAMLGTLKEDGTPVALIPGRFSGYSFYDPKSGKRVRLNRSTEKRIDTEAICFYESLPLRALTVRDLLTFMAKQFSASDACLYVGMMAFVSLLGLISPMLTKWLFSDVLTGGSVTTLASLAVFMVAFSVCRLSVTAFQTLVNARIGVKQNIAVQAAVMNRVMSLPAAFFRDYAAGELSQRASYVQNLCSLMMNAVGNVGLSSLFSLIYLGQIFSFAPTLVLPSLLLTLATIAFSLLTTAVSTRETRKRMLASSQISGLSYATISGVQKIKLAGAEKRMFARWAKRYAEEAECEYNPPAILRFSSTIRMTIILLGTLVLYYCAVRGNVGVADYYAFNASYAMISGAFMSLSNVAITLANIRPTLEMAKPLLEAEPECAETREIVTEWKGNIELSNVSFRYNDDMPYVIRDLSLKIRQGEYVAVVGSTGCGKSTLLRLLLGFEKPQKGAIYFDRRDISKLDLKSLRRGIGMVMQDGRLFLGDIYSNIVISAPELSMDDAWQAAEIAAIADDIRQMPMGMQTIISEGQGGISGGQKQRLMIARAVAPKPKILMFDEATSALDAVTQKKVSDAIDALKCTRIVIAHRLSTIRHADRILYLEDGVIAEEGTYEELIAQSGRFAELVQRQRLDVDAE